MPEEERPGHELQMTERPLQWLLSVTEQQYKYKQSKRQKNSKNNKKKNKQTTAGRNKYGSKQAKSSKQ